MRMNDRMNYRIRQRAAECAICLGALMSALALVQRAGRAENSTTPRFVVRSPLGLLAPMPLSSALAAEVTEQEAQASGPRTFTFGTIDFPRGPDSEALGINDLGQIVGGYGLDLVLHNFADHGFVLKGNYFNPVNLPGAVWTPPAGINHSGQIAGTYVDSAGGEHGYELSGGIYTSIDFPGASITGATDINESGEIVGFYVDAAGMVHGFSLTAGVYSTIDVPGAALTEAYGINTTGQVVGFYNDSSGNDHGFLLADGTFTTIDFPNAKNTALFGINDKNQMTGAWGTTPFISPATGLIYLWTHGFLNSAGTFASFDAPFGGVRVTWGFHINNSGQIVGLYIDSKGNYFGYTAKTGS